ncbi:hypothetical protein OFDDKENP_00143 [Aeromonas phage B614]|nr:hypothetical protein OFDDKENP_00143 [Aeromonas phage B614]UYD58129.1 hypothetical protein JNEOFJEA_00032 [Aeromonas phage UP87]UYD58493.1 hypothetical protein IPAKJDPM_00150 [Aeromonas phage avDM14-QBC]UYD58709.1 hypothetical protein HNNIDBEH_00116 [Aeromonas phage avDM10-HWA]UYD58988.1 hypothetical protein OFOPOMKI_00138 [Aeromonas phage avDM7-IJDJ]UYD59800.1 hypothetical protein LEHPIFIF_00027 [Aeromonas phage avDM9-HANS]
MMKPTWVEIDRDNYVITFAMNTPEGVMLRIAYTFDHSNFKLQFVPKVKAVKNPNGDGYILCHG